MANTIQSDFTYLWLDCSGHGWKASLGLTRLAQAQCHMNAVMLFLRPALLWKEYICFCDNLAGSIPRQLRYFNTRITGAGFGGRGQEGGAETASTDPTWIQLGLLDLALHQLYQIHAASQFLHLFHGASGPTGLVRSGTTGRAPQAKSHGLSIPVVPGNRLWMRSGEINGPVESVQWMLWGTNRLSCIKTKFTWKFLASPLFQPSLFVLLGFPFS